MYRSVPTMSPVRVELVAVLGLGQAEVGDPDLALGVEQQVGRLDVAVEDALLMSVFERLGHLDADPRHAHECTGSRGWSDSARSIAVRESGIDHSSRLRAATPASSPHG